MGADNDPLVTLEKFVAFLNKWQSAEKSAHPVQKNGLIVSAGTTLKCNHGREGVKFFTVFTQQIIKGDVLPGLTNNMFSERAVHGIGMGKTSELNGYHRLSVSLFHFIDNGTKKERVPMGVFLEECYSVPQGVLLEIFDKNIIFKDQDMLCPCFQAFFQTHDMGLENPSFLIGRMFFDKDKFHPFKESAARKLLFGFCSAVNPSIY